MFSEQMPLWELAIKHSLGLQTKKKTILDYKIIDDCFQQSSQNNALQWSQTNVAVTEGSIFINDREACVASENH